MFATAPSRSSSLLSLVGVAFAMLLVGCISPPKSEFPRCDGCEGGGGGGGGDDDDDDGGAFPDPYLELDPTDSDGPDHSWFGENGGDGFGGAVAAMEDIDGDGLGEVVVAGKAWDSDDAGVAGRVYVFFSPAGDGVMDSADTADVIISGTRSNGLMGWNVRAVPDLDRDGLEELIISRPGSISTPDDPIAGHLLFLGSQLAEGVDLEDVDAHTFIFFEHDYVSDTPSVKDIEPLGDLDGDGVSEIALGVAGWDAPLDESNPDCATDIYPENGADRGAVMIFSGERLAEGGAIALQAADSIIEGWRCYLDIGQDLDVAGDVDGDGLPDLLIGSRRLLEDAATNTTVGGAYLWSGAELLDGDAQVDEAMTMWVGPAGSAAELGTSGAELGDIDGDGLGDFAIGAPFADGNQANDGQVFIMLGADVVPGAFTMPGAASAILTGVDNEEFGSDMAVGDFDGDDLLDLLIGAPNRLTGNQSGAGRVYLETGAGIAAAIADGATDATSSDLSDAFAAVQGNEHAGEAVVAVPDADGDGLDEILIGARGWDSAEADGLDTGRAYLVFSRYEDAGMGDDDDSAE